MSINNLHLRKLLQLLYSNPQKQDSMLRAEIRAEKAKDEGKVSAGGDFFAPFWADAREHALGHVDLRVAVAERISRNGGRARLYTKLQDGFLSWWDDQRRWTNEPFEAVRSPSTAFKPNYFLTVKVDGFLSIKDGGGITRHVYPYFAEAPALRNEGARVSLWILKSAFPGIPYDAFRVLDVLRGRIYSSDRCYLEGDERDILLSKYDFIVRRWEELFSQY